MRKKKLPKDLSVKEIMTIIGWWVNKNLPKELDWITKKDINKLINQKDKLLDVKRKPTEPNRSKDLI